MATTCDSSTVASAMNTTSSTGRRSRTKPKASGGNKSQYISTAITSTSDEETTPVPEYRDLVKHGRLVLYLIAAPLFILSTYVQFVTLKNPDRIPHPAATGFGRDTVFLTFHGNMLCTFYSCLCLLHALLTLRRKRPSSNPHGNKMKRNNRGRRRNFNLLQAMERITHRYTAPLFSLGFFIGAAYYLLIHFHPATRLRAIMVTDFDLHMALLHLNPLLFVILDILFKNHEIYLKHCGSSRYECRTIRGYGVFYAIWSYFCVWMNGGDWPYPFQREFGVVQHFLFVGVVLLVATYLTRLGRRFMGSLDRNGRGRWEARNAVSQVTDA